MENDIVDDEYNALEDTGSTDYFLAEEEKKKKEAEEEEKRLSETVTIYYKCSNPKCGYVSKTKQEVELRYVEEIIGQLKNAICPVCGAKGFKQIDKKEYEKLEKEYKNKEKNQKNKQNLDIDKEKIIIEENIKSDLEELVEDLKYRLLNEKIDTKAYVAIFCRLSMDIAKRYSKDLPGSVDYVSYRKRVFNLCSPVLDYYNVKEDAESILLNYNEDIEADQLYIAEYKYYINDEKYAIADYEMSERIAEYENLEGQLIQKEQLKILEEKYQERRKMLEEKADNRIQKRAMRSISI